MGLPLYLAMLGSLALPCFAETSVGMTSILPVDRAAGGPVRLSVWYPAEQGSPESVGGNAVFEGVMALRDAPITQGQFPLILVSHGGLRSAEDSGAWLSSALARSGRIVVEVNGPRPGTGAEAVNEIWRRAHQLSRALDAILSDPEWADHIDPDDVSVVGFALGGTAALEVAGAEISVPAFVSSCDGVGDGPDCTWYESQNVSLTSVDEEQLGTPRRDPRITAAAAIAPEYLGAIANGLKKVAVPSLVMTLGETSAAQDVAFELPVRGRHLDHSTVFDGFAACTERGAKILAEDGGETSICDGGVASRREAHRSIVNVLEAFLAEIQATED